MNIYLGYKLHIVLFAVRRYHENILRVYFKFLLVKKRRNIFITCQQKIVHLSGTRVSTKSILLNIPCTNIMYIYLGYELHSPACSQALYCENILSVYFKFPLVKKRWNIFITCQQKMAHLSGTRVSTKKYIL